MKRAVFLDRDGVIVQDPPPGYIDRPERVALYDDAGPAIAEMNNAGWLVVVVTNQAGIAKGKLTPADLQRVHRKMRALLSQHGASVDKVYYCPYHPEGIVKQYTKADPCRKPGPGMLLKASGELDISLAESAMVGDSESDVEAGRKAGCGLNIRLDRSTAARGGRMTAAGGTGPVVRDLTEAWGIIRTRWAPPATKGRSARGPKRRTGQEVRRARQGARGAGRRRRDARLALDAQGGDRPEGRTPDARRR